MVGFPVSGGAKEWVAEPGTIGFTVARVLDLGVSVSMARIGIKTSWAGMGV